MKNLAFQFLLTCLFCMFPFIATADVSVSGDVTPEPNATGGTINGSLTVGNGLTAGAVSIGELEITDSTTLIDTDGVVGNRRGSIGIVRVDNSQWNHTDDLTIGVDGTGELMLGNGGNVFVGDDLFVGNGINGRGVISVTDSSTVLQVDDLATIGASGVGQISIQNSAIATASRATLGQNANSLGILNVGSDGRWIQTGDLIIGATGRGSMYIETGGFVENQTANLGTGSESSADVLVTGRNSVWLNRSNLTVGGFGSAVVRIDNDALVSVANTLSLQSQGRIELTGGQLSASTINNQGVITGQGVVEGSLSIAVGGTLRVTADEALRLTDATTNSGAIQIWEGSLESQQLLVNTPTGQIAGRDMTLILNGGLTNQGELAFSTGDSDIVGPVTNTETGVITMGGVATATFFEPISNSGTINVHSGAEAIFLGDVTMAAESRVMLAAKPVTGTDDEDHTNTAPFAALASVAFGGTLEVSTDDLDASAALVRGDTQVFELLSATSATGSFERVEIAGLQLERDFELANGFRSLDRAENVDPGMFWTIDYGTDGLSLTQHLALAGDTNGDKHVDFADFLSLSANFGKASDWLGGDIDGNGTTEFSDFLELSANFGTSVQASTEIASVPEPAMSTYLLVLTMPFMMFRNSRKA